MVTEDFKKDINNSLKTSCLYDPVILGSCDPKILGLSEHLEVKLPLGP